MARLAPTSITAVQGLFVEHTIIPVMATTSEFTVPRNPGQTSLTELLKATPEITRLAVEIFGDEGRPQEEQQTGEGVSGVICSDLMWRVMAIDPGTSENYVEVSRQKTVTTWCW